MNGSAMEGFINVDVAKASNDRLVEQQDLDRATAFTGSAM
jgi:hypothetical protein